MTNKTIFYPEQLISLIEQNGNSISYKKGEFIYHPGDPTAYIYTVQKGQVFISRMQEDNHSHRKDRSHNNHNRMSVSQMLMMDHSDAAVQNYESRWRSTVI